MTISCVEASIVIILQAVLSLTVPLDAVFHELSFGIKLLWVLSSRKVGKGEGVMVI